MSQRPCCIWEEVGRTRQNREWVGQGRARHGTAGQGGMTLGGRDRIWKIKQDGIRWDIGATRGWSEQVLGLRKDESRTLGR